MPEKSTTDQTSEGSNFLPKEGERSLVVGQTGSGKTLFVRWLLERMPNAPWVIYDTKDEPKFESLPRSRVVRSLDEADEAVDDPELDYVVIRPHHRLLPDPEALDGLLEYHYLNWRQVGAYIDELYSFHKGGQAGPGLVALYTRGRSRGITLISSTQRPAWISRFALSEAQKFYQFFLGLDDDVKRMEKDARMTGATDPPEFHFWFKRQGREAPRLMKPVRLDDGLKHGYIDASPQDVDGSDVPTHNIRHVWI